MNIFIETEINEISAVLISFDDGWTLKKKNVVIKLDIL